MSLLSLLKQVFRRHLPALPFVNVQSAGIFSAEFLETLVRDQVMRFISTRQFAK